MAGIIGSILRLTTAGEWVGEISLAATEILGALRVRTAACGSRNGG